MPETADVPELEVFFLASDRFYTKNEESGDWQAKLERAISKRNLSEWNQFFDGKLHEASLDDLVYQLPIAAVDSLIFSLQGKPTDLGEFATLRAELAQIKPVSRAIKALYYLGFAKRVEPFATEAQEEDKWQYPSAKGSPNKDERAKKIANLIAGGETLLKNSDSDFLADRYRFQLLRLHFYSGDFERAARYFRDKQNEFKTPSSLRSRFMEYGAGALAKAKSPGEANAVLAKVFAADPDLRPRLLLSFRPLEDSDWQQSLALTTSTGAKEALYALFGLTKDGLAAMEKLAELNPNSPYLRLLMTREVNKAEQNWTSEKYPGANAPTDETDKNVSQSSDPRIELFERIVTSAKVSKLPLWQVALGHLKAIAGDLPAAKKYLDLASKGAPSGSILDKQIKMSQLFLQLRGMDKVDKSAEKMLADRLTWLGSQSEVEVKPGAGHGLQFRMRHLYDWSLKALSSIYSAGGDKMRSLLLFDNPQDPYYADNQKVDSMLAFLRSRGKTPFDRYLAKISTYSIEDLTEIKVINFLYLGKFDEAAKLAVSKPDKGAYEFTTDSESARYHRHRQGAWRSKESSQPTESRRSAKVAQEFSELSQVARGKGEAAARANVELGRKLYDLTYFGKSDSFFVSVPHVNFGRRQPVTFDMTIPERYYVRAMELSKDKETQAQACFAAAETERDQNFAKKRAYGRVESYELKETVSPKYFEKLKTQFADTDYYKEIVGECGYFRNYLAH